jgi:hypothetical protein
MSKLTALTALLVLGTSASAMAATRTEYNRHPVVEPARRAPIIEPVRQPVRPAPIVQPTRPAPLRLTHGPSPIVRTEIRDRGWDRGPITPVIDAGPRRYRPSWVALGAPVQLARTSQDCIDVSDLGTFTQLRLQNDGGIDRIDQVTIQFADGSTQITDLDRVLDDSGEFVEIPLDGNNRQIDRIFVTGAPGSRGELQVYAI